MSKFFGFNILTNLGVTSMEHITPGISLFGNRFRWNKLKPIKAMKRRFEPSVYQNLVVEEINKFFGLKR